MVETSLDAAQGPIAAAGSSGGPLLGARLRASREAARISLRELARRVGVSASFLSQVERDKAAPSVGTLYTIVSELGLTLDSVMREGDEEALILRPPAGLVPEASPPTPTRQMQPARTGDDSKNVVRLPETGQLPGLQRAEGRAEILLGGVRWERLTPADDPEVEFLRVTYGSGTESCPPDNIMHHGGKEYFHILSGQLDVQVGFARQTMRPGDSVNFDSSIPHRLSNPYPDPCVAIWFVVGRSSTSSGTGH
ncbi:helix-turn-helix domain-containing protein [Pseudarthrobacter enclensis]|uniref:Transcriptional regulator with XRE-family HTH domain n=1 Tax=Pseudarthrobacter enclensis TaxID=993070 RepID=A0ABT9RV51_9MICC|nr:transcriptional regulator with XRE-family HTH domain [Pseudarthrobacter enclensis]